MLVRASPSTSRIGIAAILSMTLIVFAEITRYEAWLLAPIFGAFVFFSYSDRSLRSLALVSPLCSLFRWCGPQRIQCTQAIPFWISRHCVQAPLEPLDPICSASEIAWRASRATRVITSP
jgi:hypothetical protein